MFDLIVQLGQGELRLAVYQLACAIRAVHISNQYYPDIVRWRQRWLKSKFKSNFLAGSVELLTRRATTRNMLGMFRSRPVLLRPTSHSRPLFGCFPALLNFLLFGFMALVLLSLAATCMTQAQLMGIVTDEGKIPADPDYGAERVHLVLRIRL
ncbi:hypothetical protein [Herbaspirillum sp. VT-16-41]|uniref:hypothetical protein n=1 Tax=Herbaspirillum sp. VT-16-41 TaxID=1953765 RepID=UPI00111594FE|nr:hypothetical protein [Herbaspirillum sp. VT-16-41]